MTFTNPCSNGGSFFNNITQIFGTNNPDFSNIYNGCSHPLKLYMNLKPGDVHYDRQGDAILDNSNVSPTITIPQTKALYVRQEEKIIKNINGLDVYSNILYAIDTPYEFNNYSWIVGSSVYVNSCIQYKVNACIMGKLLIPKKLYSSDKKNPIGIIGVKKVAFVTCADYYDTLIRDNRFFPNIDDLKESINREKSSGYYDFRTAWLESYVANAEYNQQFCSGTTISV
ncbi:MAG: hypothetical protein ACI4XP_01360 [Acutalibacteraceae bacterium]